MSYWKNQRSPGDASAANEDVSNFEPYPVVTPPKDGQLSLVAAASKDEMETAFGEDFEPLPYNELESYALGPQVADFLDSSPVDDVIVGDEGLGVLDNWQADDPRLPEFPVETVKSFDSEESDFKHASTCDEFNIETVATEIEKNDAFPSPSVCKSTTKCQSEHGTSNSSANEVTRSYNPPTADNARENQAAPTAAFANRTVPSHTPAYYHPWHYYNEMYHHPHAHLAHAGYSHYNQHHHAYNTQVYHHGRPYPPRSHYYPRQSYHPTVPCGRYSKPLYMACAHMPIPPQSYIKEVSENDVICGRGGAVNNHPGNKRFRQFIQQFKHEYMNETKQKKPMVALRVLELVKRSNPPGRFLVKFPAGYLECSEDRAREKASQALREGAAKLRKSGYADDFSVSTAESKGLKPGDKVKVPELPKCVDVNYRDDPAFCQDFDPPVSKVKEEYKSIEEGQAVKKGALNVEASTGFMVVTTAETNEPPIKEDPSYCIDSIGEDDLKPPRKKIKQEED